MTRDRPHDGDVETTGEFDAALGNLLTSALRNDVDPQGSWEYRTDGAGPDLEVMVVELEKPRADD